MVSVRIFGKHISGLEGLVESLGGTTGTRRQPEDKSNRFSYILIVVLGPLSMVFKSVPQFQINIFYE